jgi:mannose-1-phosphate guanylyltransferase
MAGGVGSRFWPMSTPQKPKQFLDVLGIGKSLLRLTFERMLKSVPAEHIYILTNTSYRELVKEQLPELSFEQILCEPMRKNTSGSPHKIFQPCLMQSVCNNALRGKFKSAPCLSDIQP